jgi:UDP-N-acetylglucosamine--N-acetylmuramyl-(pentapeptide) pyrophosphoryl-undecaprenol N-acetylglucosamine transferase
MLGRLWQSGQLWSDSQRCFETFEPEAVVGFGGWISAPVLLAARRRGIPCLLHEQNVALGRANRWLAPWVTRIALSFHETAALVDGRSLVITGMPVRPQIGRAMPSAVAQFGLAPDRPVVLVVGGSQGSRAINRLLLSSLAHWTPQERRTWQVLHITGAADEAEVRAAYAQQGLTAWVGAYLMAMEAAYAAATLVVARAGASTIAELALCGKPALLIPYPHAHGHQRLNARLVEAVGGGVTIEESRATPARIAGMIRTLVKDERLRAIMGRQIRELAMPQAVDRLTQAILTLRPSALTRSVR